MKKRELDFTPHHETNTAADYTQEKGCFGGPRQDGLTFHELAHNDDRLRTIYCELRQGIYREQYPWLPPDFGCEDETDRVSHIVVAMQRGEVVGGARLTISSPSCPRVLPLECAGFRVRESHDLVALALESNPFGEISRMAVLPKCRRGFEASTGLGRALCAKAAREGLDVVLSICPEKVARINSINSRRSGVECRLYFTIPTPFGIEMYLCAFVGLQQVFQGQGEEAK